MAAKQKLTDTRKTYPGLVAFLVGREEYGSEYRLYFTAPTGQAIEVVVVLTHCQFEDMSQWEISALGLINGVLYPANEILSLYSGALDLGIGEEKLENLLAPLIKDDWAEWLDWKVEFDESEEILEKFNRLMDDRQWKETRGVK